MIPLLTRLILIAVFLAAIGACARTHRPAVSVGPSPAASEDMAGAFQTRLQAWENFEARLALRAQSPKGSFSLRSVVLASPPERARLEASNIFGQTVAALLLDTHGSVLWVPSEKTVYQSIRAENLLRHFLGISLPPDLFVYGLVGSIPPGSLRNFKAVPDGTGWTVNSTLPESGLVLSWKVLAQPFSLQSIEARWRSQTVSIRYEPPVLLSPGALPQKIHFTSAEWQMDVTVNQMQSVPAIQEESFQLPIPAAIRRVHLNGM